MTCERVRSARPLSARHSPGRSAAPRTRGRPRPGPGPGPGPVPGPGVPAQEAGREPARALVPAVAVLVPAQEQGLVQPGEQGLVQPGGRAPVLTAARAPTQRISPLEQGPVPLRQPSRRRPAVSMGPRRHRACPNRCADHRRPGTSSLLVLRPAGCGLGQPSAMTAGTRAPSPPQWTHRCSRRQPKGRLSRRRSPTPVDGSGRWFPVRAQQPDRAYAHRRRAPKAAASRQGPTMPSPARMRRTPPAAPGQSREPVPSGGVERRAGTAPPSPGRGVGEASPR